MNNEQKLSVNSACWIPGNHPDSPLPRARIRGINDILEIEGFSPSDLLLSDTTYDYLKKVATLFPDKTAIRTMVSGNPADGYVDISYRTYLKSVTSAANLFSQDVNDEGKSVVAMMTPLLPESLYTAWGGCTAGILCPINPFLDPSLVINILNSAGATTLVTTQAYGPSAADHIDLIRSRVPSLKNIWLIDCDKTENNFSRALSQSTSETLNFPLKQNGDSISIFLPTGGTTGTPKMAKLTHRSQLLNSWIAGAIMGAAEDEIIGVGMPLFHVGGLLMLSLRALVLGQTNLLLTDAGFRNPDIIKYFWDISRQLGMTSLIATPTSAASLLNQQNSLHQNNNIRTFTCGGSTVPVELGKAFESKFGIQLREVWGATEFHGFLGCSPNDIEPTYGSVGLRVPFHDVSAFILDENNHFIREANTGEPGVICGKGPCVSPGYLSESNDPSFFVADTPSGDIWGSSGDMGYIDENGYIWITGRQKDIIIRGGHNIDPRMIEEVLVTHPSVELVAAVGYPDASKGELPVAYIQLVEGQNANPADLIAYCKERISERAATPVKIFIIPSMPLTAVGKIFKPTLRNYAIEAVVRENINELYPNNTSLPINVGSKNGRPLVKIGLPASSDHPINQEDIINKLGLFPFIVEFQD